jgi:hypothetical protein
VDTGARHDWPKFLRLSDFKNISSEKFGKNIASFLLKLLAVSLAKI